MPSPRTPARLAKLNQVLTILAKQNPRPRKRLARRNALDLLVLAFLSQNTNMANSRSGYKQLRRALPTWSAVLNAPVETVERHIAVCGLARIRARRLQDLLRTLQSQRGHLSLQFLKDYSPDDAHAYLLSLHGVGPKTAAYCLCFAFDMPIFPVDHGIWRVARRLRLVRPAASEAETTTTLTRLAAPGQHHPLHTLLFDHAKTICLPKNPKCRDCPLLKLCPAGQSRHRHRPDQVVNLPPKKTRTKILARYASAGLPMNDTAPSED